MAIRKIWLQQPIAFARVGGSKNAVSAFRWTEPDLRPRGSGRTTIVPGSTFDVDPDGALKPRGEKFVLFKDEEGIRPICPYFELHGEWDGRKADESTRVSEAVLGAAGLSLRDIRWEIRHANHKAYAATHSDGDRIEAQVSFFGDDHSLHELRGRSPSGTQRPLVAGGAHIPMGSLQAILPDKEFPYIRLRFMAPKGLSYAPSDFAERVATGGRSYNPLVALLNRLSTLIPRNRRWRKFPIPGDRCILNRESAWAQYKLLTYAQLLPAIVRLALRPRSAKALICAFSTQSSELMRFALGPLADVGKLPPGLYASWIGAGSVLTSLGIIDDLGDGIISCKLRTVGTAHARIVVAPPQFSPDRRPPVTIADVLTDKEQRAEPRHKGWASGNHWADANAEIEDLLDRAFETAAASNLDAWAVQRALENASAAIYRGDRIVSPNPGKPIWGDLGSTSVMDLPLFQLGAARHHRNTVYEVFEQLARDNEGLITQWIRDQDDPMSQYYDRKMPALMRGSDRRPMHLTRRQYAAFMRWFEALRARQLGEGVVHAAAAGTAKSERDE